MRDHLNSLQHYKEAFSRLNSDVNSSRYPASTLHRAPHKPFLLLAILDLIAQGVIQTNFIALTPELVSTFDSYWVALMGPNKRTSPLLPFTHLRSDGFWHFVAISGKEEALKHAGHVRTWKKYNALVEGAKFDEPLFILLQDHDSRETLRAVLVAAYFSREQHPRLLAVGEVVAETFSYSRTLQEIASDYFVLDRADPILYRQAVRSGAFRRVVTKAYDYSCAVCGIRLITSEGRIVVEAAHIKPWSISHNDDPRNGLALCGLHHWVFDQGLIGITQAYQIKISPEVPRKDRRADALTQLKDQSILLPKEEAFWPSVYALNWHLKEKFRSQALPSLFDL